jgi:hypothetical protein
MWWCWFDHGRSTLGLNRKSVFFSSLDPRPTAMPVLYALTAVGLEPRGEATTVCVETSVMAVVDRVRFVKKADGDRRGAVPMLVRQSR